MLRSAGKQGKRASFLPSDWVLYDDVYVILKETEEADYCEVNRDRNHETMEKGFQKK